MKLWPGLPNLDTDVVVGSGLWTSVMDSDLGSVPET